MKMSFGEINKKLSWNGWVFILLLFIGIFLRTYNFHDWQRFNADQSRDATVVSNYLSGEEALPLLGPKAGGTNFRVGPIFYYFQIAGAKIFGNYPDKMAYPDLLFSILAIPLLFIFLRKYFDIKTALLLTAIFSVSLYAIKYSRFAWNPNSLPFWSLLFLYGLHEIMIAKESQWKLWSLITGIALGVGIQLHTLSLLFFPIMLIGVFGCLLYQQKKNIWKMFFIICFAVIILNGAEIVSEIKTGGENTTAFFNSIGAKEKKGSGIVINTMKDVVCFSQSSTYILSSYDSSDKCELKSIKHGWNIPAFMFGLIISFGGFILAVRYFKREKDLEKKYFLGIFILYVIISFLILIPLANEISMRFFLILIFMPFVFLGLWFKYLSLKFSKRGYIAGIGMVFLLLIINGVSINKSFAENKAYLTDSEAGMDNVLLKEVEVSAAYILAHNNGVKIVSVTGDAQYLFKALKSMQYFTSKSGVKLVQKSKKTDVSLPVFLIENTKQKNKILQDNPLISDYETFGRFTIFSFPPAGGSK